MKYSDKDKFRQENDIPDDATLMLFRNPNEFKYFIKERINPNHKIIIWGFLKKKYRRTAKFIQVGKIFLPLLLFIPVDLNIIVENIPAMFYCFILVNLYLFFTKMETLDKCLSVLKADLDLERLSS